MKRTRKKLNIRKVFNAVSIVFLTTCVIVYGFRFLTLYIKNNKKMSREANTIAKKLKTENKETMVKVDETFYFSGKVDNNYVLYSGMLWRVIKIEADNSMYLISDNTLTLLANGEELSYDDSRIVEWLNKSKNENSGILEKAMNNYTEYLVRSEACNDKIDAISNSKCTDINEKYYFNSLTVTDYVNTGAAEGFINNGDTFYLSDYTTDNLIWYVNNDGKVSKSKGTDIYGVRPVIKLKGTAPLITGTGTKEDPFTFDSTKNTFGAYVTLGDDKWRIIGVDGNNVKLAYDGYLMSNGTPITHKFSTTDASYNIDVPYSAANYLNYTFYNNLSYKDIIISSNYPRGYYGSSTNYDYASSMEETVEVKVGLMSIGDIFINPELSDYFLLNTSATKNTFVYTVQNTDTLYTKSFSSPAKLIPVITIDKTKLVGTGTKENPYRMEAKNEKEA